MKIKILGAGCRKCVALADNTAAALEEAGRDADIEKVTDIVDVARFGVMSTPALVVDEKVVSVGKVPSVSEIAAMLADS